jgi:hypothetical protein
MRLTNGPWSSGPIFAEVWKMEDEEVKQQKLTKFQPGNKSLHYYWVDSKDYQFG